MLTAASVKCRETVVKRLPVLHLKTFRTIEPNMDYFENQIPLTPVLGSYGSLHTTNYKTVADFLFFCVFFVVSLYIY